MLKARSVLNRGVQSKFIRSRKSKQIVFVRAESSNREGKLTMSVKLRRPKVKDFRKPVISISKDRGESRLHNGLITLGKVSTVICRNSSVVDACFLRDMTHVNNLSRRSESDVSRRELMKPHL